MSLSPRVRKWALVTTFAGLNAGFLADGIQASKEAYGPEGQGDVAAHMYATKALGPVFETSARWGGAVGVMGAYAATAAVGVASLPGVVGGEYIGKALYKPAQP